MSFFSELEDITDEAINTFGKDESGEQITLVYDGVTVPCFEEDSEETRALMDGGIIPGLDMIVRAKASAFPSRPKALEFVTILDAQRKILRLLGSKGDPEIRLALQTLTHRK